MRPKLNKDGCHQKRCLCLLTRNKPGDPTRERNECGLFLFFDNFTLLLSTIASFKRAERSNSLSLEDIEQVVDRSIAAAEMQWCGIDPEFESDYLELGRSTTAVQKQKIRRDWRKSTYKPNCFHRAWALQSAHDMLSRGYTCDFLLAQVMRFFENLSRRRRTVVAIRVTNSGDKMCNKDRTRLG